MFEAYKEPSAVNDICKPVFLCRPSGLFVYSIDGLLDLRMFKLWLYHRQRPQCSYQFKRKDEKDFSKWSYRRIYARGFPSFERRFSHKSSKNDGLRSANLVKG